jgi:hypothetical protein
VDLNALSNEIEQNLVDDEYGFGQEVEYTRRSGGSAIPVNAFCTPGDFRKKEEHRVVEGTVADKMSFLSVFLEFEPVEGDKIVYAGNTWYVKDFYGTGPYDLFAEANKQHIGARSGRRSR